jgi:nucleotide-binding universal stress UspA family protein
MDFSLIVLSSFYPAAQRALQYADSLASCLGGRLVLLHVNRTSVFDPYVFAGEGWRRQELEEEVDTGRLLAQLAQQLRAPATVEVATDLLPPVAQELATRRHPTLYVVGVPAEKTSYEPIVEATLELLRAQQLPVLLVPVGSTAYAPPRRTVVAADRDTFFLPPSAAVVSKLLPAMGAELTVAHVSEVEDDASCTRALRAVQQSGLVPGVRDVNLRGYPAGTPAAGLLAAITDTDAELVVVQARSRSYLSELFHRSVTAALIRQSPVPVLIVPVIEHAPTATSRATLTAAAHLL